MADNLKHCGVDMWAYEAPGVYDGTAFWFCSTCKAWRHRFASGTTRRRAAELYAEQHPEDLPPDKEMGNGT